MGGMPLSIGEQIFMLKNEMPLLVGFRLMGGMPLLIGEQIFMLKNEMPSLGWI
ncbi:hypothetical protein [Paenibacillus sp. J2TS4]|uniref:hypothetical protein n=1 Tax=Paenibacillus sp. J2TS4 TaxID=2807194 RepID=UPI001B0B4097|nr:hypothetical protein [Paenibacillus sp. J2TS4]GIP36223.1 hypothetical protein J2TS4_54330 [Paenibacillus sp. J2TS4]